jgi:hypothetical protein
MLRQNIQCRDRPRGAVSDAERLLERKRRALVIILATTSCRPDLESKSFALTRRDDGVVPLICPTCQMVS